jgi:putative membrane protein
MPCKPSLSAPGETGDELENTYVDYPFVKSMLLHRVLRDASFKGDAYTQFEYPKGNEGWMTTLFVLRGRALDQIIVPLTIASLHAVLITLLVELDVWEAKQIKNTVGDWTLFYAYVLNVTLSFLLVFRLNRSASRYWLARKFWGLTIALGRSLTSGILTHGEHNPTIRDEAIRWIGASAVAVMAFMRGDKKIPNHTLEGVLDNKAIEKLESAPHMPIYACDRARDYLKQLFPVTRETPVGIAHAWTVQLDRLEDQWNHFMNQFGDMERVRGTPLPIVYVSH